MSHFSVLVIGEDVEGQLAPFHEFECTGEDNEYVKDVDITAECRKEYEEHTDTRYCDPDGGSFAPYEDRFYRDPTEAEAKEIGTFGGSGCTGKTSFHSKDWGDGRGYRSKVHFLPEGWEKIEIPTKAHREFTEFVADYHSYEIVRYPARPDTSGPHKFGYILVDQAGNVRVIDRTNPSKKWDWYQIGGRFTGRFKLKAHAMAGALGTPGIQADLDPDYEAPAADRADQCFLGDIDLAGMRDEAGVKAGNQWDDFHAIVDPHPPIVFWKVILTQHGEDVEAARKEYRSQPGVAALAASQEFFWSEPEQFAVSRDVFIERALARALSAFAVLKDGQWYERGEMGWWGNVSDEKDEAEWNQQFNALLDGLPDNTLLTIVDCHI